MPDRRLLLSIQMQTAQAIREMQSMQKHMERLENSVNRNKKPFENLGQVIKNVGRVIAGVSAAFGAIGVIGIKAASDMEETQNKFGVVFKGVEQVANELRDNLVANFGTSRLEASKMLSAMQDFLVPMGLARDAAAKLSGQFSMLAVDIGSFNNAPTAQVMEDIQSAIAGMSRPLRKYGIDVSETTIKQMALERGIKLTNGKLDQQTRAMLIYEKITKDSADAMGDFARSQDSFANQLKIAKARAEDLAATFGQAILPAATKGLGGVIKLIEEMQQNDEIFESIGSAIESMIEVVLELLPVVLQLVDALSPVFSTVMHLATVLLDALKPAFEQIVRIIDILAPIIEKLLKAISPLIELFGDVFATALEIVADLLESLSPILNLILDVLGPIFEALKPIVHILGEVLKPILELILLPLTLLGDAIKNLMFIIDDSLHHWENLAKANAEAIEGLEKTREQYERMEVAIKNGSMKNSELLKTQKELIDKYPELQGAIDLVNGSYEDNMAVINQTILRRKEEQIHLLEQTKKEIEANKKRAESWLWLNKINQVFNPVQARLYEQSIAALGRQIEKIGGKGGEIEIARRQLAAFKEEMNKPPKPKGKTGGRSALIEETKKTYDEVVEIATEAYDEIAEQQAEMLHAHEKSLEDTRKTYEQWANTVTGGIGDVFSSMGEALATGEDAWAAFAKAAIGSIAGVLDALAQEFLVKAAAAAVEAIFFPPKWAEAAGWTAAGAAASLAAGLVRGFAGSFAEGGSFMTSGPTMMRVGDNSGGVEQVTVTPVSSSGANAEGMNITQPIVITIDGRPIYRGLLKASKSGIALISKKAVVN